MAVLNDVLDFSKIEAGKPALDPAAFHLPTRRRSSSRSSVFERSNSARSCTTSECSRSSSRLRTERYRTSLTPCDVGDCARSVFDRSRSASSLSTRSRCRAPCCTVHLFVLDIGAGAPGQPPERTVAAAVADLEGGHVTPSRSSSARSRVAARSAGCTRSSDDERKDRPRWCRGRSAAKRSPS